MATYQIAKSVTESSPVPGVQLLTSRMGEEKIVTIVGSFLGGHDTAEHMMVPEVLAELYTEGTKKHSKESIETVLESMGATVDFSCGDTRLTFVAKCLSRDTAKVLEIVFEEFSLPACTDASLAKVKKRLLGLLEQAEDSTRTRATDAFLGAAYPEGHPHHTPPVAARIALLKKVSRRDVLAHHAAVAGTGSLIVSVAGDVAHEEVARALRTHCASLRAASVVLPPTPTVLLKKEKNVRIHMEGKPNVDVMIGAPLAFTRHDPDYLRITAALGILGGREGFNGRLMQIVREKMGLTYGIYAMQNGYQDRRPGYWFVWGGFGPKDLEKGLAATRKEIARLVKGGVTDAELKIRKNIVAGSHAIALSTTGSRAAALLMNAEDGRSPSFLDQYPALVQKLTKTEVNKAIKKHLHSTTLVTSCAGGIQKQ